MKRINSIFGLLILIYLFCQSGTAVAQSLIHPKISGPGNLWVNSYNGVLFFGRTDIACPNTQMPLELRFYYNSSYAYINWGFGNGFSLEAMMTYEVDAIGGVTIQSGDGRRDHYTRYDREYKAPAGVHATLTQPQIDKFLLVTKTGERYEFFNVNYPVLTAKEDRFGNRTEYTYTDSLLTGITDAVGHTLSLTWSNGLLTQAQGSMLRGTITYTYDADGRLQTVKDADNGVTTYRYDNRSRISRIIDAVGNTTNITYNISGMTSRIKTADSDLSIRYEADRTLSIVYTQPKNQYSYFKWDNQGRVIEQVGLCCGIQSQIRYDEDDNVIARTDANGNTSTYTYDDNGNMLSATDALGNTERYTYTLDFSQVATYQDKNGNTYSFTYDDKGCLIQMTAPLGVTSQFAYDAHGWQTTATDANGNVTSTQYNDDGTVASVTDPAGFTVQYAYDQYGNLISKQDARQYTTSYQVDAMGRIIEQTNPLNGKQRISYDKKGRIVRLQDEAGHISAFTYNSLDNVTSVTDALGHVTSFTYDGNGNIISVKDPLSRTTTYTWDERHHLLSETNPAGEITSYDYDGHGNLIAVMLPNGNTYSYTYDALNRLTSVTDAIGPVASYTYDANGNRLTETDGIGRTMTYAYDALNRMLTATSPAGEITSYTYDNKSNVTLIRDALQKTHTMTYSSRDELLSEEDALHAKTLYAYDGNGNLIRATDARGNATVYTYDALNRNTVMTFPDARSLQYTYDAVGNIIRAIDRGGNVISLSYDAQGRLLTRQFADGTSDTYSYDAAGQLLSANNAAASIAFAYDNAGRVRSETLNGRTTSYVYQIADNIRRLTYPSGTVVEERLNARDRIIAILKNGNEVMQAEYNYASQDTKRTLGNGVIMQYAYDSNGRLTEISDNKQLLGLQMTYDAVGNMLSRINTLNPSRTETYTYDAIGQLTQMQRGTSVSAWQYDLLGNRTSMSDNGTIISYSTSNMNAYTSITAPQAISPQYDNNGNLLNDGTHTYTYDFAQRLTSTDANCTYTYDALGRRVSKTTPLQQLTYFYVGDQMVEEYSQGQLARQYVYGNEIDEIIQMQVGDSAYYYHTNHIGSVMAISDFRGALVEHMDYDAFGRPAFFDANGTPMAQSKIDNTILFTGREYDYESGNYYFRARHLHPTFGRFMQHDPLLYIDGMNDYAYTKNNAVVFIDVWGTKRNPIIDFLFGGCLDLPKNWKCAKNGWEKAGAVALCGLDIAGFIPGAGVAAKGSKGAAMAGKALKAGAKKAAKDMAEKSGKDLAEELGKGIGKGSKNNPFNPNIPIDPPSPKSPYKNPDDYLFINKDIPSAPSPNNIKPKIDGNSEKSLQQIQDALKNDANSRTYDHKHELDFNA